MEQYKEILIENLIEKCYRALDDARFAIEANRLEIALNRAYYAIFYIVAALGYKKGFVTGKHGQLLGWFNKNFIKENIFEKKFAVTYKDAYEFRMKSDYEFTYKPTVKNTQELLDNAKEFIKEIHEYVKHLD